MKLKKGDTVIVIAGKDKGKTGEITEVSPKSNKVKVAGVNTAKRHTAARGQTGYKIKADGTKVRVAKSTGDEI